MALAGEPKQNSRSVSLGFLKSMMTIRELEQRALDLSRVEPHVIRGSIHLCAGQEAVPVGTLAALEHDDQIVSTYRGHGWAIASGLSLVEVFGEICHRTVGINGGRGGSAYMMAPHRRFIGENSIVGAGVSIACGVALANRACGSKRLVVVSLGDGAFNQGATHEGLAFAAAQSLPLIVICENNGWSEMTPTSATFKVDRIARRALGYGINGVTIDGSDPYAVMETVSQAAERIREGDGPVLIECRVPRLWGHYNNDIEHYRSREDRTQAQARDPISLLSRKLLGEQQLQKDELHVITAEVKAALDEAVRSALAAPEPEPSSAVDHVFSDIAVTRTRVNEVNAGPAESKQMTYIQAVNEALRRELEVRANVIVYGEDVGRAGGIFGASRNLQKTFGEARVFDTPIAENAILGSAVGAALMGLKPVVEIMWVDFMMVALDQLINQAANIRYITSGRSGAPLVVRTQQGATPGSCAQHSQCLEAMLAHIPGLRVATPATPQDAYDILRAAVAGSDPCIVIEARALYQKTGPVCLTNDVDTRFGARLHGTGRDAIIVTWSTMVAPSLEAAEALRNEGRDVAVLDLRWLSPIDDQALIAAARTAGGRIVVAHEANRTGGFGAEVVARVTEALSGEMNIRAIRVASPDVRIPASPILQNAIAPNIEGIRRAVLGVIGKE